MLIGPLAPAVAQWTAGAVFAPGKAAREATRDVLAYWVGVVIVLIGLLMIAWGPAKETVVTLAKAAT